MIVGWGFFFFGGGGFGGFLVAFFKRVYNFFFLNMFSVVNISKHY